ncbi:MAG: hypothetical protein LBR11_01895, partial [Deltaproteobacteria bacterium]|nr:hypothetical protein [Deltaproteobacteria bacterium]
LEAGPILFHSGYLTLDKITRVVVDDDDDQEPSYEEAYSFRLPNLEVKNSYYRDCFSLIFGPVSKEDLNAEKEKLIQAFLSRDAQEVRAILSAHFTRVTYFQKPDRESDLRAYLQLLFQFYKFKVQSELPGSKGRLDLSLELPGQVVLVMELKYRPNPKKILTPKENESLASLAYGLLPKDDIIESLATLASQKLKIKQKNKILLEISQQGLTVAEQRRLFVQAAQDLLSEVDMNKTLASLVLEKMPLEIIKKELLKLGETINLPTETDVLSDAEIDRLLDQATQEALRAITQKNYPSSFGPEVKNFIDLAIAFYDDGSKMKVLFGPDKPEGEIPQTKAPEA